MSIYKMSFDVLILNIVLILSKKSFLKDLNCYRKNLFLLIILKFFIFFAKTFNPAGSINKLLFACKKRMAF